jgi:hypothetical protein
MRYRTRQRSEGLRHGSGDRSAGYASGTWQTASTLLPSGSRTKAREPLQTQAPLELGPRTLQPARAAAGRAL